MALASANAVSPAPAAGTAAGTNASAAPAGNGTGGTFTDSLVAALAPQSASGGTGVLDASQLMFGKAALSKLKSKLKGADAALALTPQQLQQQQAFLQKLQSGNSGINIAALRMALAKSGQASSQTAPDQQELPVLDPVTGKVEIAKPATPSDASSAQGADAASQMMALQQPANPAAVPAANAKTSAPADSTNAGSMNTDKPGAAPADPAKDAAHAASQTKLAAALVQAAQAPVVKAGQDDGSKVPNAKVANGKAAAKPSPKTDNTLTDPAAIQALGAKIAATAGATNTPDTAHAAARNVALAEVAAQQATATPAVTKLESAAMTNAAQVATHQTTPEQKVEAQALPIQFGVQQADAKDGNASPQSGKSGTDDKNPSQQGNTPLANAIQKTADTQAPQNFVANQQPAAPTHTAAASTANVNTDAGNGNTVAAAPIQTAPVAATLQVSQQQPQQDPAPDQTTFAALGVAIAARSKDGARQFDINMHPADLGKIDVRISVDSSGQAQAHLTAEHPQTLQLLKQDQTTLAQNLRDAGLNLANNGLNFSLKGEQQSSTPTFNTRSRALSIAAVQTPDIVSTSSSANIAPGDSRLDIRV
jgi:flagellar hook-length control protein FliK